MKNSRNTDEVGLDHLSSYGNDYRNMSEETVSLWIRWGWCFLHMLIIIISGKCRFLTIKTTTDRRLQIFQYAQRTVAFLSHFQFTHSDSLCQLHIAFHPHTLSGIDCQPAAPPRHYQSSVSHLNAVTFSGEAWDTWFGGAVLWNTSAMTLWHLARKTSAAVEGFLR